jgi:membrane protein YqaA with SNARE-associated domain
VVGAASLAHCVAGTAEALCAVLAATLGNTVGGVIIVSLLNYAQVMGSGRDIERTEASLDELEASDRGGQRS